MTTTPVSLFRNEKILTPDKSLLQKALTSEHGFKELNHKRNNSNFACEIDGSASLHWVCFIKVSDFQRVLESYVSFVCESTMKNHTL